MFKCFAYFGVCLFFSVAERMHLFLPSAFLITLIGAHLTEAVLQEILWTLLRDICVFQKRMHNFCRGENADHHPRLFLVREISGIWELASWLPVASKPKGVRRKTEFTSTYFLSENTYCNQSWNAKIQHIKRIWMSYYFKCL